MGTMTTPGLPREDIHAAMAARRELGPEYDAAFVDAVVDRLREGVEPHRAAAKPARAARRSGDYPLTLAVISMVAGIPLTAIGADQAGLAGLIVVWIGLVLLNACYTTRPR